MVEARRIRALDTVGVEAVSWSGSDRIGDVVIVWCMGVRFGRLGMGPVVRG